MALTYTPAGRLGDACPPFSLPSVDGKRFTNTDFKANRALVVMFICNHCPYVQAIEDRLIALAREFIPQGIACVGICANDPSDYPEDQPGELFKRWREKNYAFPYLIDADQTVAKAFGAVCTPDLYVYDAEHKLCYRGRLDDSWRDASRVQKQELRTALQNLLSDRPIPSEQNPSMGCSIKWKKE
jgi:peroxiredoxin